MSARREPRPRLADTEKQFILNGLARLAQVRRETIDERAQLVETEQERHRRILAEIARGQLLANESLVRAVDDAYEAGVPKQQIYDAIGISGQRIGQLRESVQRQIDQSEGSTT